MFDVGEQTQAPIERFQFAFAREGTKGWSLVLFKRLRCGGEFAAGEFEELIWVDRGRVAREPLSQRTQHLPEDEADAVVEVALPVLVLALDGVDSGYILIATSVSIEREVVEQR
jgi:hypothetical protein